VVPLDVTTVPGLLEAAVTVSPDKVQAEKVLQAVEHETASLLGPVLAGVTVEWI